MKGATLKATLERLGVLTSYSRPSVSDDNPYVESLFGTMKTRVGYPKKPFATLEEVLARDVPDGSAVDLAQAA